MFRDSQRNHVVELRFAQGFPSQASQSSFSAAAVTAQFFFLSFSPWATRRSI